MIYTPLTVKAMNVAYNAHHGQKDKAGAPYIFHPIHVAEQMEDETTTCIALLHDVLEDTSVTLAELEREFPLRGDRGPKTPHPRPGNGLFGVRPEIEVQSGSPGREAGGFGPQFR